MKIHARVLLLLMLETACFGRSTQSKGVFTSEGQDFRIEILLEGRGVVWGFDFLPDHRILFTERDGRLSIFDLKRKHVDPITGVPKVFSEGQGGLLDVRVDPLFPENQTVYLAFSDPVPGGATTTLARAKLEGRRLSQVRKIATAIAVSENDFHFGSRIEFGRDGDLFFTVGDRGNRLGAQERSVHNGKILHVNKDGKVEVWTSGHRNPQGLAMDPTTGILFECEFGPRGGDEINAIEKGKNYGWPIVTFGREYHGPKIGEGTHKDGMEDPIAHYVPSISPSGMGFYTGEAFPRWKGNLFLATLSGHHIRRVVLKGKKVVHQEALLSALGWRFRNVRTGPEGWLYVSTDEGRLARLVPVQGSAKEKSIF